MLEAAAIARCAHASGTAYAPSSGTGLRSSFKASLSTIFQALREIALRDMLFASIRVALRIGCDAL
jgi:hypothetical protein